MTSLADTMLWLMYLSLALAVGVTALSLWRSVKMRTKADEVVNGVPQTRIAWTTAAAFVVCLVVTWMLGSSEPLVTNGTRFTSPFWLKLTDMFIYTSIILIIACFAGAIVSRFRH